MARERQMRAQHVPHTRFVAHANISNSFLASDELDGLYDNGKLISKPFIMHFTAFINIFRSLTKAVFEKTAHANEPDLLIGRSAATASRNDVNIEKIDKLKLGT